MKSCVVELIYRPWNAVLSPVHPRLSRVFGQPRLLFLKSVLNPDATLRVIVFPGIQERKLCHFTFQTLVKETFCNLNFSERLAKEKSLSVEDRRCPSTGRRPLRNAVTTEDLKFGLTEQQGDSPESPHGAEAKIDE